MWGVGFMWLEYLTCTRGNMAIFPGDRTIVFPGQLFMLWMQPVPISTSGVSALRQNSNKM